MSDRVDIERAEGSGSATIINVAAPVRDGEGKIMGGVVAGVDITEQRRAEEAVRASEARLREAQRLAKIGSWEWVVDSEVITWSEGLHLILGRDPADGPPSFTELPRLYSPESWEALRPAIERAVATGAPYDLELEMIRKDGTICWTLTRCEAVRGPSGAVVKLHGTVHEINERKLAEQERERLVAALREADRRKNEFLAMLSHELRNPLAPIRNSLYILERAVPGGEQARRAQAVIDRQVGHMTRLVDDLLDVTRITRGKVQLQRERLALNELAQRTVEDHRSVFVESAVELEMRPAPVPVWVSGDATRLAQAIGNLLQNAAKFTPRGGATTLTISVDEAREQAVLTVRDTGRGIAPEVIPELFEFFAQGDTTLDRSKGGLGLGLALVKGLIEQHGGAVEAKSAGLGCGSEFTLRLPLDPGEPVAAQGERAPAGKAHRRVLVIEDNVDAAESLREVVEFDGHEVVVAYDGIEGLAKAKEFRPDLVLCDIGLPGIDGYAVARGIREDDSLKGVQLVALSGYALPDDVQRAAEAGFDQHLAKPPSVKKLESVLNREA